MISEKRLDGCTYIWEGMGSGKRFHRRIFFYKISIAFILTHWWGEKAKREGKGKKKEMGKRKSFIHISGVFGFFIQLGVFISML